MFGVVYCIEYVVIKKIQTEKTVSKNEVQLSTEISRGNVSSWARANIVDGQMPNGPLLLSGILVSGFLSGQML